MASLSVYLAIDWPNWAASYVASIRKRAAAGEKIDTAKAVKLILAFTNYRIG